jgi:nucleoside-diphosphate-sugar epimerase
MPKLWKVTILKNSDTSFRVVVVGCNGFIGKALTAELSKLGINHVGLSKEEFNLLDERVSEKLKKIIQPTDHIVFTSAIAPSKSPADVQKSIKMVETFTSALADNPCKQVVLISSDAVYGDRSGMLDEKSPCNPNSFHGLAQLSREIVFQDQIGLNLAILRVCAVYGNGDTHNGYGPNRFLRQIENSEPIRIFGEGLNVRDHICIEDVVKIVINSIEINFSGILNVVSGYSYTFMEVAQKCKKIFSPSSHIEKQGSEGEILIKQFNASQIQELFPDIKTTDLDTGLSNWKNRVTFV